MPTAAPSGQAPGEDEWATAKPVPVTGAEPLNCAGSTVREWVRIACKEKDAASGKPTMVANIAVDGQRPTPFSVTGDERGFISELFFPFDEGADVRAEFWWTNKSVKFTASWPKGTPRPLAYGAFGAPMPAPTGVQIGIGSDPPPPAKK